MSPPSECRALLRALLAAVVVSYLICVLIMSGMQKEDLDVSMLLKLQRYSVNIDDMNNDQHRQECLSRKKDFTSGKIEKNNDDYVPTTEKATTAIEDPLRGLSMTAVLNYLKSKQSTKVEKTTTSLDKEQETRATEYFENQSKSNIDLFQRYVQLDNLNNSIYKSDKSQAQTTSNYNANQNMNIKIDEINSNGVKNNEFINTIFKDYLLQTKIQPTTTENIITRETIDIQNVYKRIEELISSSKTDNNKEKTIETLQHNIAQKNKYIFSSNKPVMFQDQPTSGRENQIKNIYDFLTTVNQFKSYSSVVLPQNNTTFSIKANKYLENNIMTTSPKQVNYEKIRSNVPGVETDISKANALSSDLVKEIAKTVKDVIIKDLRNELSNIYREPVKTTTIITTTTTTTTTETPPTTSSKIITKGKELAIMDTFMELYEQIKALKQTTFVLDAHNKSITTGNKLTQETKISPQFPPIVNYNNLRKPETKVPIFSVGDYNKKQYFNLDPYVPRNTDHRHVPITLQTNSIEIQPLAVSVSKPESLINQNIVVNTRYSSDTVQQRNQHPTYSIPRQHRYSDIRVMHRNRTHKYSPLKQYNHNIPRNPNRIGYHDVTHDDVIRFRVKNNGNSRIDTDYYERINFGDYKAGDNGRNVDYENHNIPRFHERLERVDDRIAALPVKDIAKRLRHNDDDVPERQQLSLVDMKKGTSYDDTHFKNFLNTQQKVTDILERILATRPKTNTPLSVEAT